jgi:hypothetical protein
VELEVSETACGARLASRHISHLAAMARALPDDVLAIVYLDHLSASDSDAPQQSQIAWDHPQLSNLSFGEAVRVEALVAYVRQNPGCSAGEIRGNENWKPGPFNKASRDARKAGLVEMRGDSKRAARYWPKVAK